MNEMQVFQNSEFGELGVLEIEGKPYFPAKAVAKALGYSNTNVISSVWNTVKPIVEGIGNGLSWIADKVGGLFGFGGNGSDGTGTAE